MKGQDPFEGMDRYFDREGVVENRFLASVPRNRYPERSIRRAPALKVNLNARVLYFAYGSNLHAGQMTRRCPSAKLVGPATLDGFQLVFRGVADVRRSQKAQAHGAVWSITKRDLVALDRYEGWPYAYDREKVAVRLHGRGDRVAWVYRMTRERIASRGRHGLPSEEYLRTCATGYRQQGLDTQVLVEAVRHAARRLRDAGYEDFVPEGKVMRPVRRGERPTHSLRDGLSSLAR